MEATMKNIKLTLLTIITAGLMLTTETNTMKQPHRNQSEPKIISDLNAIKTKALEDLSLLDKANKKAREQALEILIQVHQSIGTTISKSKQSAIAIGKNRLGTEICKIQQELVVATLTKFTNLEDYPFLYLEFAKHTNTKFPLAWFLFIKAKQTCKISLPLGMEKIMVITYLAFYYSDIFASFVDPSNINSFMYHASLTGLSFITTQTAFWMKDMFVWIKNMKSSNWELYNDALFFSQIIDALKLNPRALLIPWRMMILSTDLPAETECSVCLDSTKDDYWMKLSCDHFFHIGCIQTWGSNQLSNNQEPTCPLCRESMIEPTTETSPQK